MRRSGTVASSFIIGFLTALMAAACGSTDGAASSAAVSSRPATSETAGGDLGQASPSPGMELLVEAAEQEGTLNLNWAPSNTTTMDALVEAFTQTYDIDVTVTPTPSFPANLATLVEEHSAGQPASTDVYLGSADFLLAGGPDGHDIFEQVDDWGALAPHVAEVATDDGFGVSLLDQIPGFAYNTQEIAEHELPSAVDDVPKLEQPIASTAYAAVFNLLSADELLGREGVTEHLEAFEPAGLIGCAELDRVASGEFAALWISCGSNIVDIAVAKGAPLDSVVMRDAGVIHPWYMAVPKHAVNPNAAKLWMSWLVTPEAQRVLFEHEFADNRLIDGSRTAEQVAGYEADGVSFVVADYDFVRAHPEVSDPDYLAELGAQLGGE